jgi:hypothetical protein
LISFFFHVGNECFRLLIYFDIYYFLYYFVRVFSSVCFMLGLSLFVVIRQVFLMTDVGVRSPLTSLAHPFLTGLRSDLRSARNFLNVFSLNIRSIVPKLTELRTFLVPSLFHILAFSGTWLKSRHSNQLVVVIVLGRLVVVLLCLSTSRLRRLWFISLLMLVLILNMF